MVICIFIGAKSVEINTSTKYDDLLSEAQLEALKELRIALEKKNAPYLEQLKNDPTLSALKRKELLEKFYDDFNSFIEVKANEMLKIGVIRGETKYWRSYDDLGYVSTKPYSAEILSSTSYNEVLTLDDITKIDVLRDKLKEEYEGRLHDPAVIEDINAQCESLARKIHLEHITRRIKENKSRVDALKDVRTKQPDGVPIYRYTFDVYECIDLFKFILPQYLSEEVTSTDKLKVLLDSLTKSIGKELITEIIQQTFVEKCIENKLKWVVKDNPSKLDEFLLHIYNSLVNQNNAISDIIAGDVFVHNCVIAATQSINEILELEISTGWELLSLRIHSTIIDVVNYGDYRIHAFEALTVEEEDKKWPLGRRISLVRGK